MKKYAIITIDKDGVKEEHPVDFASKIYIRWAFFLYKLGTFLYGEEKFQKALGEEGITHRVNKE